MINNYVKVACTVVLPWDQVTPPVFGEADVWTRLEMRVTELESGDEKAHCRHTVTFLRTFDDRNMNDVHRAAERAKVITDWLTAACDDECEIRVSAWRRCPTLSNVEVISA